MGDAIDPWLEVGRRLGRRAGADFLRRLDVTENGTVMLCARKHRGRVVEKWIDPAERIDDRDEHPTARPAALRNRG